MTTTSAPFGRLMTAMITPMTSDGAVDYDGAAKLAAYLVDDMRNEGIVVNGTTGEAPTTTDDEKSRVVKAVLEAVGDRASVVAGVGTNITAHTIELARPAERGGAGRPLIVYDVPARTATAVAADTLIRLAQHPRIVAVKDAKGDIAASSQVLAHSDLAYYSGDDPMTLALMAVGGIGIVSVTAHVVGDRIFEMIEAFSGGRNAEAAKLHLSMLPVNVGLFRNQAAVLTKAAMDLLGLPGGRARA